MRNWWKGEEKSQKKICIDFSSTKRETQQSVLNYLTEFSLKPFLFLWAVHRSQTPEMYDFKFLSLFFLSDVNQTDNKKRLLPGENSHKNGKKINTKHSIFKMR